MALPRVSAIGFIDTLTVSAVGFVDGIYLPPATGALTGVNATSSAGAISAVGTAIEVSGVNATASDGTVAAIGPAILAPISGVNSTTSAARISSPLVLMTNIKVGSSAVDKLYVGGTRIYKAYSGYDLVWYQSQRTTQYRGDTSSHNTNGTTQVHPVNSYWRRYLIAFTYTAAELANWDIISGSVISKLRWYVTNPPPSNRSPYPKYAIRMMHITNGTINTNPTNLGGLSSSNVTDVKSQHNYVSTATGYHEMTLDNNFTYNGTDAIGFIFAWGQIPTGYTADGQGYILSTGTSTYLRTDSSGEYLVTDTATITGGNRPVINMYST
jgi:hypothetical protein